MKTKQKPLRHSTYKQPLISILLLLIVGCYKEVFIPNKTTPESHFPNTELVAETNQNSSTLNNSTLLDKTDLIYPKKVTVECIDSMVNCAHSLKQNEIYSNIVRVSSIIDNSNKLSTSDTSCIAGKDYYLSESLKEFIVSNKCAGEYELTVSMLEDLQTSDEEELENVDAHSSYLFENSYTNSLVNYSPNVEDNDSITTGDPNLNLKGLHIYPNPNADYIKISVHNRFFASNKFEKAIVEIYNEVHEIVNTYTIEPKTKKGDELIIKLYDSADSVFIYGYSSGKNKNSLKTSSLKIQYLQNLNE